MNLEKAFNKAWYGKSVWTHIFYPFIPLVTYFVLKKRKQYLARKSDRALLSVPVIIVGNITVGGTGKSPMVIALAAFLKEQGYKPGIVSRGHGVNATEPTFVHKESSPQECGDEPVMLAKKTACPLVVCRNRVEAVSCLLGKHDVDVILSDDGMQHYALERDIEILMIDEGRGLGNGHLLPVGPLREPVDRLLDVDFIVSVVPKKYNEAEQQALKNKLMPSCLHNKLINTVLYPVPLIAHSLINVFTGESKKLDTLSDVEHYYLMAGIGNPERFLNTLLLNGLQHYECHWFNDHHDFQIADFPTDKHVIMTEKDAVKCRELVIDNSNLWYLSITIVLPMDFKKAMLFKLQP